MLDRVAWEGCVSLTVPLFGPFLCLVVSIRCSGTPRLVNLDPSIAPAPNGDLHMDLPHVPLDARTDLDTAELREIKGLPVTIPRTAGVPDVRPDAVSAHCRSRFSTFSIAQPWKSFGESTAAWSAGEIASSSRNRGAIDTLM